MKDTEFKALQMKSMQWPLEKKIRFEGPPVNGTDHLILKKKEVLHFSCETKVFETRIINKTYRGYAGTRIHIGPLPVFLGGSFPHILSTQNNRSLGKGRFFITNRRVVCIGNTVNFDVRLSNITSLEEYSDGLQIISEGYSGNKIFLMDKPHIAQMTLISLLKSQVLDTPLWVDALASGSYSDLQIMILRGFDVNCKTKQGLSPLIIAAMLGRSEAVRLLMENGADISHDGSVAIKAAFESGNISVFDLLHRAGIRGNPDIEFDIGCIELPLLEVENDPPLRHDPNNEHCRKILCKGRLLENLKCDTCGVSDFFHPRAEGPSRQLSDCRELARQLLPNNPVWPFALAVELLKQKRDILKNGLTALEQHKYRKAYRRFPLKEYVRWLDDMVQERLLKHIIIETLDKGLKEFNAAMSRNHHLEEDLSPIFLGVSRFMARWEKALHWEINARFTQGPEDFQSVHNKLEGCVSHVLMVIDKFIRKLSDGTKTFDGSKTFVLEFNFGSEKLRDEYVAPLINQVTILSQHLPKTLSEKKWNPVDTPKTDGSNVGCIVFLVILMIFIFLIYL